MNSSATPGRTRTPVLASWRKTISGVLTDNIDEDAGRRGAGGDRFHVQTIARGAAVSEQDDGAAPGRVLQRLDSQSDGVPDCRWAKSVSLRQVERLADGCLQRARIVDDRRPNPDLPGERPDLHAISSP